MRISRILLVAFAVFFVAYLSSRSDSGHHEPEKKTEPAKQATVNPPAVLTEVQRATLKRIVLRELEFSLRGDPSDFGDLMPVGADASRMVSDYYNNSLAATKKYRGGFVVVSGTVERVVSQDGKTIVQLMSPYPGQPVFAGIISAYNKGESLSRLDGVHMLCHTAETIPSGGLFLSLCDDWRVRQDDFVDGMIDAVATYGVNGAKPYDAILKEAIDLSSPPYGEAHKEVKQAPTQDETAQQPEEKHDETPPAQEASAPA